MSDVSHNICNYVLDNVHCCTKKDFVAMACDTVDKSHFTL